MLREKKCQEGMKRKDKSGKLTAVGGMTSAWGANCNQIVKATEVREVWESFACKKAEIILRFEIKRGGGLG